MKIIYVAGKYRASSERQVFENIMCARSAALKLWDQNWAVICPHTNCAFMGSMLGGDDKFIDGDLEILSRCDAVYFLSNYKESEGAMKEYALAVEQGKELFFEDSY